jgi:hypothetical protein
VRRCRRRDIGRLRFWDNTIDLARIGPPRTPPGRLRAAGVHGHAGSIPLLVILAAACERRGIAFRGDLLANGRNSEQVELVLSGCDLVLTRGRMAIEALERNRV